MLIKDGPGLDPGTHTLYDWLALSHFIAGLSQVQEGVSFTIALLFAALAIPCIHFSSWCGNLRGSSNILHCEWCSIQHSTFCTPVG